MWEYKKSAPFLISLIVAIATLASYLWYLGDRGISQPTTIDAGQPRVGGPFSLIDQNGKVRTEADYRGRYMLMYFGYTNCPDVCPTTLAVISAALNLIGKQADGIAPIFITVDPTHDTPQVLKNYLASFDPRFIGLTGNNEQIAVAAKAYRVYYQRHPLNGGGYSVDHSSVLYLMAPDGAYRANFAAEQGPELLAKHLQDEISQQ